VARGWLDTTLDGATPPPGLDALAGTRHLAVVLVDGLGVRNLAARTGHARHLARRLADAGPARLHARFPSTTAASLTSLATGLPPIGHGLVGYTVWDPDARVVRNELSGWGPGMAPAVWQPHPTVFERAAAAGITAVAIGPREYTTSGFTRATLRGATYVGADDLGDRFDALVRVRRDAPRSLVQLYVPELDRAGHRHGWQGSRWAALLEALDAETDAARLGSDGAVTVLTGDHGMLDVAREDHALLAGWSGLDAVLAWAGEPRGVQLVLREPAAAAETARALQRRLDETAGEESFLVTTGDALVDSGLMGDRSCDDGTARRRLGDVIAIARDECSALYRGDGSDDRSRRMIGQHGGLSAWETELPLLLW
jgi:hypothetical protein